jgi:DNA-binding HxlR family transcriptional regulator
VRQTSFEHFHCSLARGLDVVGDWWTPLIVRDLALGLNKFDQLVEDLGISRNLLTKRLADLEENAVVYRRQYEERPPRWKYYLTDAGSALVPILMALSAWGDRWVPLDAGVPVRFRHRSCGAEFTPTVSCSNCGESVQRSDVVPVPGPGIVAAPGTQLVPDRLRQLERRG